MLSIESVTNLNDGSPMPVIGLGTWQIKGGAAENAVRAALDAGYRLVDTAAVYGNEKEVGAAIKKSGLPREDIFVTTKIWNDDHDDPKGAIESSLKRLKMEYVDLYLIHWPVRERIETWKMLEKFQRQGLAKSIGVSNFTIRHLKELLTKANVIPSVNQVEFNPFLYQRDLLEFCSGKKILLEAYSPLSHGVRLTDKDLEGIASKYKKTSAQIMIRWCIQRDVVAIPKSSSPLRIAENANVFDFTISEADMKHLDALNQNYRTCWDPTDFP